MRIPLLVAATALLAFAGCVCKPMPERFATGGPNTVCILSGDSAFKKEVAAKVAATLEAKGRTVIRDKVKNAGRCRAADFGGVVYITEYRFGHTPRHAARYFQRNGEAPNIVFVITAGDSVLKMKIPFDAVTSASKMDDTDRVADEVVRRLDAAMERGN